MHSISVSKFLEPDKVKRVDDHRSCWWLVKMKELVRELTKWLEKFKEYNFKTIYCPGIHSKETVSPVLVNTLSQPVMVKLGALQCEMHSDINHVRCTVCFMICTHRSF